MESVSPAGTLFPMSPLAGASSGDGGGSDLSFTAKAGGRDGSPARSTSAMSTDSCGPAPPPLATLAGSKAARDARPPFGEATNTQPAAFSFGKPASFGGFGGQASVLDQGSKAAKPRGNPFAAPGACRGSVADAPPAQHDQRSLPEPSTPASAAAECCDTHTPLVTPPARTSGAPAPAAAASSSKLVWADVLTWRHPMQSAVLFVTGLAAFWFATWAAYGAHKFTLVSGLSYLLLADLGANFCRYFVSKAWHDKCLWGDKAQMKALLTRVNTGLLHAAAAHDAYLSAVDPFVTLKVAGALWAAAWIGAYISLWWCLLLGYLAAFSLPAAYKAARPQLNAAAAALRAATIDKVDALGLSRTVRFAAVASGVALLFLATTWTQAAIGLFVAATYWRTLLKSREIDLIRTAAEPYTRSVRKVGRRLSTAAEDAFGRMSAAPASRTRPHFRAE